MVKATTIATRIPSSSVSSFDVMDRFMSFDFANAVPFLKTSFFEVILGLAFQFRSKLDILVFPFEH
jgi:hypothetical protein